MARSAVHLNGNLLVAIDTETTGLIAGFHDILQLALVPVSPDLTPSREYMPFNMIIQPKRPENADDTAGKVSKTRLVDAITNGIEAWTAVDRFRDWFESLRLPPGKKIVPLGANFQFDHSFLLDFFGGPLSYDEFFRSDYRDVQKAALFINDVADFMSEKIPFPKVKLTYLCSCLKIPHPNAHDAVADCCATIEVYRRLMRYRDHYDASFVATT